jgi:hypothetical protein
MLDAVSLSSVSASFVLVLPWLVGEEDGVLQNTKEKEGTYAGFPEGAARELTQVGSRTNAVADCLTGGPAVAPTMAPLTSRPPPAMSPPTEASIPRKSVD